MKLRIKGNSIRLRLTQSEVARVGKEGLLENRTDLSPQPFRFVLIGRPEVDRLSVRFKQSTILVIAPQISLSNWATNDAVGLYGEETSPTGEVLTIAVEKDFRCLDRSRAEDDEADAYPHPGVKSKKA